MALLSQAICTCQRLIYGTQLDCLAQVVVQKSVVEACKEMCLHQYAHSGLEGSLLHDAIPTMHCWVICVKGLCKSAGGRSENPVIMCLPHFIGLWQRLRMR